MRLGTFIPFRPRMPVIPWQSTEVLRVIKVVRMFLAIITDWHVVCRI